MHHCLADADAVSEGCSCSCYGGPNRLWNGHNGGEGLPK
jgi:hypothetical protein